MVSNPDACTALFRAVREVLASRRSLAVFTTHAAADVMHELEARGWKLVRSDDVRQPETPEST